MAKPIQIKINLDLNKTSMSKGLSFIGTIGLLLFLGLDAVSKWNFRDAQIASLLIIVIGLLIYWGNSLKK